MKGLNRQRVQELLSSHGQQQLLPWYHALKQEEQEEFARQMEGMDWSLIELARSGKKEVVAERGVIEPIESMTLAQIKARYDQYEQIGREAIQKGLVGAVLLAGGQGTRLGSDHAKGLYNIGITKDVFIFQRLIENLLEVTNRVGAFVPLYIMTSDINHEETVRFFREKNYFGYPQEYILFYVQSMAPAVDYDGKLLMETRTKPVLSPNGNGGWFASMHTNAGDESFRKVIDDIHERGIAWLNVFAVDNVLQRIADPVFIGATIDSQMVSGAKVVKKVAPDEKVGAICKEDGKPSIVEYYDMTPEMMQQRNADGEYSYLYGVILNYLFRVDRLEEIMDKSLEIHLVEKKIPHLTMEGEYVRPSEPNGFKFEMLVLDMIHLLENCLPFEVIREREFAPIKNKEGIDSIESARKLLHDNGIII